MTDQLPKQIVKRRRRYFKEMKAQYKRLLQDENGLKCTVPGCENSEDGLVLHHILPIKMGGSNDISNMMVLCKKHHKQIHNGKL